MTKTAKPRPAPRSPFSYPKGWGSLDLHFSRKGQKLAESMRAHAKPRLLPKLRARTKGSFGGNRAEDLSIVFNDACIYLTAWLGEGGMVEFPFARLYPVRGGRYNLSVRRLLDWSQAEDNPPWAVFDYFTMLAPNAKHWVKLAQHKTFEECVDLLVKEPTF
jgi:hypothetical protein